MWNKPWRLAEGFCICAGLVFAGLMLQWSVGSVVGDYMVAPANYVVLAFFLGLVVLAHAFRQEVYAFSFLSTGNAAVPALIFAALLTLLMGFIRQSPHASGMDNMLSFWPFVLTYVYLAFLLGLVVLRRLSAYRWRKDTGFLISHVGLIIVLLAATLGNADMKRLKMITTVGQPEWRALDENQNIVELPVAIQLNQFIMETFDDGSPRKFSSDVQIFTQSGKNLHALVDVNHPVSVDGWKVYQYGYDTQMGPFSQTSIFELVSDPWLPAVYLGIALMLLGAVWMFLFAPSKKMAV